LLFDQWIEEFFEIGQFFDGCKNNVLSFEIAVLFHLAYKFFLVHGGIRIGVLTIFVSVFSFIIFIIPYIEKNANLLDNDSEDLEKNDPEQNDWNGGNIIEKVVISVENDR
jgi:hypothetical protein